ncbi:MAG: hypothetical protein COW05_02015 [Gammaproteobacteria bacterium CG12_big_fil_rev_8_21_14_0_65_46_12]|nr:MAG: hypothetical protein COW05_02015 [Gammaproteobacteria bacterium CG12_big_fil_rev_8_21_14_0_65_46_12]
MRSWEDKALYGAGGYKQHDGPDIIPDEHYAAIGKVVDTWADLEHEVDMTIWRLIGEDQNLYACITAQLVSILPKLDALTGILDVLKSPKKPLDAVLSFKGKIGDLVLLRNRVVHDPRVVWYGNGDVARFDVSAKGRRRSFEPKPETVEELLGIRNQIDDKIQEFKTIKMLIEGEIPSSAERPQSPLLHKDLKKDSPEGPTN